MTLTRYIAPIALVTACVVALAACSPEGQTTSALSGTLNGAGASSQSGAQEAWVAAFQTAHSQVTINYEPSGSGSGRDMFKAGGIDFAGSDAPLSDKELAGSFAPCVSGTKAIDIPAYISPIAVVFNVTGVPALNLDAPTLARIFSGSVTMWNDPAITAFNPDANLPAAPITAVHRSDNSGTTTNLSDYFHTVAPSEWEPAPADSFPFPRGEGAQGTSGVVDAVKNGVNTIGYVDASRAGTLSVVALKVGNEFVTPTPAGAAATVSSSARFPHRDPHDFALTINRTSTDPQTYPLILVSYIIVCQRYRKPKKAELIKAYLGSIVSQQGQQLAADASGSAPLSADQSSELLAVIDTIGS